VWKEVKVGRRGEKRSRRTGNNKVRKKMKGHKEGKE
jgi:hypothetical protein